MPYTNISNISNLNININIYEIIYFINLYKI